MPDWQDNPPTEEDCEKLRQDVLNGLKPDALVAISLNIMKQAMKYKDSDVNEEMRGIYYALPCLRKM